MPVFHFAAIGRSCLASARLMLRRLLPCCCALCGEPVADEALCKNCIERHALPHDARCPVCARTQPGRIQGVTCGACLSEPPAFDASIVACDYAAPMDHLVQDLKFRARLALAPVFAQLLMQAWKTPDKKAVITGVPLSRKRLAERGFNQANEIAKEVARHAALPMIAQLAVRVRDTGAQAGLPLAQRRVNMRGAFAVLQPSLVRDQHIVVVDDVITTGHTLHELAACLKRHGAASVTNLVVARTPEH